MILGFFYPPTRNAARRPSKANVLLALCMWLLNFELAAALRHNAWFWGLCHSSATFLVPFSSGSWENLLEFSKHLLLFPALIALIQLCSIQQSKFSCVVGDSRPLSHPGSLASAKGFLGIMLLIPEAAIWDFLRLTRLFPLIPLFTSIPISSFLRCWKCRSGQKPSVPWLCPWPCASTSQRLLLGFPEAPPRFSRGSSQAFPAHWWCWLESLLWRIKGKWLNSVTVIGLGF